MHELMTGEKYVPLKSDEKSPKKGKATLKEVKEEAEKEEGAKKKNEEGITSGKSDSTDRTPGK